jgi:hypothetical protein
MSGMIPIEKLLMKCGKIIGPWQNNGIIYSRIWGIPLGDG